MGERANMDEKWANIEPPQKPAEGRFAKNQRIGLVLGEKALGEVTVEQLNAKLKEQNDHERMVLLDCAGIVGVPKVYETKEEVIGRDSGLRRYTLEMEKIKGKTLDKIEVVDEKLALSILTQAGRIAGEIYAKGYIYNDFKPNNLILNKDGKLTLVDFNLAQKPVEGKIHPKAGVEVYNAPEKQAGDVDVRSDIYSLTAVVVKALGAQLRAEFAPEMARTLESKSIDNLRVSEKLKMFLNWNLSTNPSIRCQNWDEFSDFLKLINDQSVDTNNYFDLLSDRPSLEKI